MLRPLVLARFGGHALSVKSVDGIDEDYGVQLSPLLGSLLVCVRNSPPPNFM